MNDELKIESNNFNYNDKVKENEIIDDFGTFQKKTIAESSVDVARAFTEVAPQFSKDGKVNYYICGSLAQNILPCVNRLHNYRQSQDGKILTNEIIDVSDSMRLSFLKCARKKGDDYDIVEIGMGPGDSARKEGNILDYDSIKQRCRDAGSLSVIQDESRFAKPVIDDLYDSQGSDDGFGDYYYSIAEIEGGNKLAIASPFAMIGGKAFELMYLRDKAASGKKNKDEKIKKDECDLFGLCSGFSEIYKVEVLANLSVEAMDSRIKEKTRRDESNAGEVASRIKEVIAEFVSKRD